MHAQHELGRPMRIASPGFMTAGQESAGSGQGKTESLIERLAKELGVIGRLDGPLDTKQFTSSESGMSLPNSTNHDKRSSQHRHQHRHSSRKSRGIANNDAFKRAELLDALLES